MPSAYFAFSMTKQNAFSVNAHPRLATIGCCVCAHPLLCRPVLHPDAGNSRQLCTTACLACAAQEKVVNSLQRQLEGLLANYRILEQVLACTCPIKLCLACRHADPAHIRLTWALTIPATFTQRLEAAGVPIQSLPVRLVSSCGSEFEQMCTVVPMHRLVLH